LTAVAGKNYLGSGLVSEKDGQNSDNMKCLPLKALSTSSLVLFLEGAKIRR